MVPFIWVSWVIHFIAWILHEKKRGFFLVLALILRLETRPWPKKEGFLRFDLRVASTLAAVSIEKERSRLVKEKKKAKTKAERKGSWEVKSVEYSEDFNPRGTFYF